VVITIHGLGKILVHIRSEGVCTTTDGEDGRSAENGEGIRQDAIVLLSCPHQQAILSPLLHLAASIPFSETPCFPFWAHRE
jgi:hypothetical protein